MNDTVFSPINTLIRIKEKELLTKEQFEALLKSKSMDGGLFLLKSTPYAEMSLDFEPTLAKQLVETYQTIINIVPVLETVDVFSLIYVYHNLKVLLKMELAQLELEHLLIPIGRFTISELTHAVKTDEVAELPSILLEAIKHVKSYYAEYESIEAVDILLDRAYFQHLHNISQTLQHEKTSKIIQAWTDLYNVSCLLRLKDKAVGRSFLLSILSEYGQLAVNDLVEIALSKQHDTLYALLMDTAYANALDLPNDTLQAFDIEKNRDKIAHYYLEDAKFEPFGMFPVLAFLYYKEMEIKNLRLVLTGKENDIEESILRERMRPIYEL